MRKKLYQIIIPFLISSFGLMTIYSFLNWVITIHFKLFDSQSNFFDVSMPLILSVIISLIIIRKRLQLLNFSNKKKLSHTILFSSILLAIPVMIFQFYIGMQSREILRIDSLIEIYNNPLVKNYSIKNAIPDKKHVGRYCYSFATEGAKKKAGCYYVCPLIDTSSETKMNVWIGVTFGKRFSNSIIDNKDLQKDSIDSYLNLTVRDFENYSFTTNYLTRVTNSKSLDSYIKAIRKTDLNINTDDLIVLREENGDYSNRARNSLNISIIALILSNIIWFLIVFFAGLKEKNNAL